MHIKAVQRILKAVYPLSIFRYLAVQNEELIGERPQRIAI